jgi:hypothetical protein
MTDHTEINWRSVLVLLFILAVWGPVIYWIVT